MFGWRRLVIVVVIATLAAYLLSGGWKSGPLPVIQRAITLGMAALVVFGVFEQWPRRLPAWLPRWVLQVGAVTFAVPFSVIAIYILGTPSGAPPFWRVQDRLFGFGMLLIVGLMLAPATAFAALVRQKELEREELERSVLDTRLRLLQAQVAPHFLFNTLANVQALVDAGSPRASAVLRSLTAYLRAAVPRLDDSRSTLAQELQLVQAYLELMHTRMPDRLQYTLDVDPGARPLACPPMAVLTLVENAVRHGIDPSEEGGSITVQVQRTDGRCIVRVNDTGVGLLQAGVRGTGLANLRERLQLMFGGATNLQLCELQPHGVRAELEFPAREVR